MPEDGFVPWGSYPVTVTITPVEYPDITFISTFLIFVPLGDDERLKLCAKPMTALARAQVAKLIGEGEDPDFMNLG